MAQEETSEKKGSSGHLIGALGTILILVVIVVGAWSGMFPGK